MIESNSSTQSASYDVQNEILNELKKGNALLASLLETQKNVRERQRRFWFMAVAQIALLVVVVGWYISVCGL